MPRSSQLIGDSLVELAERLPAADLDEIWTADRHHPTEAAVDTPFLARMRALLAAIDGNDGINVARARRTLRDAAPMMHLQPGSPGLFELDLLLAALHRDLLHCTETQGGLPALLSTTATLERGAQAHLVVGHPLAALVEPWIDQMLRDPVADLDCDPRLEGPWISVPFLLVQLLAHAGELDLGEVAQAMGREADARAADVRLPWPLPDAVVGLVVGLCVEFGMATWDGDLQALGRAEITPLGLWAQLTLRAHVDGELPSGFAEATMPAHAWN
jgi:hypothetical protein